MRHLVSSEYNLSKINSLEAHLNRLEDEGKPKENYDDVPIEEIVADILRSYKMYKKRLE